ncbi:MAG TPA: hypothetical protein PL124_07810 [Candidatus Cloacimonadota bacterium]|jgi:transposase|nr:hypothetical protein [Candidatus Cloacimonadota bacterium]
MYIRKVIKQNKESSQKYTEYRLVRSQRIGRKVSQHTIITMQEINLPKYQWTDLADEIWSIYMMLNAIESAFRTMKSELQLRPIRHQKGERVEAHLFITVLAYHIVNAIRHRLKENDINSSWNTIRKIMRNHLIIQTSMQNKKGETITILNITTPEDIHLEIYEALNLNPNPIPRKVSKLKLM